MLLAYPEPRRPHPKNPAPWARHTPSPGRKPWVPRTAQRATACAASPAQAFVCSTVETQLARIPLEAVSNLRLPSVSLATPSSSPRNDRPALFVRPVLAPCTFSAPRRSPPRASLDSEVRWTRRQDEPRIS